MPIYLLLDSMPIWGVYLFTVIITWIAFEVGFHIGRYRKRTESGLEVPIGSIVTATLGLLAFMLAFTFSLSASRFDERRKLVLEESNAIGTTYFYAKFASEPYRSKIQALLKDYTTVRLEGVRLENRQAALKKSIELQDQLGDLAQKVAEKAPRDVAVGLFLQSLSDVMNIHVKRVTIGVRSRVPQPIWHALYFMTFLAIAAMGYHTGLHTALAANRCLIVNCVLVLTFSSVIALIADLDRPQEGALRVSQQSMIDLYNQLNSQ